MRELDDEEMMFGDISSTLVLGVDIGQRLDTGGKSNCGLRHTCCCPGGVVLQLETLEA